MPANEAGQGEQAEATSQTASTPGQAEGKALDTSASTTSTTPDKQTTDEANAEVGSKKEEGELSSLDRELGIPKEILAQFPKDEEEEKAEAEEKGEQKAVDTTASTPPEAKAEPEGEDPEDEDDQDQALDTSASTPDEKPDKRQKRINRLTRKNSELEDRLDKVAAQAEKLKQQLDERDEKAKAVDTSASTTGWFPDAETARTHQELSAERDKADALIRWCNENTDGATTMEGDKETFISPQQVAQWKSRAEETRLRTAPEITVIEREAKHVFRAEQTKFDNLAKQTWPELFDKSTKEYQTSQAILKQYPSIKLSPDANYAIGLVLEGMRSVQGRSKKEEVRNGEKTRRDISPRAFEPRVPIAPHTPEPPSREVTPSSIKKVNEAMSRLKNDPDGGAEALAAVFAAEDEMSSRRAGSRTPVKV